MTGDVSLLCSPNWKVLTAMNTRTEPTKDLVDVTSVPLGALLRTDRQHTLSRAVGEIVDEVVGAEFHVQEQIQADDDEDENKSTSR